jgi:phenylacetaldehyde dehydrogenase
MILEAGFPAGVVNIVNGFGHDAGAALAAHPHVDKISFTGSTATGKKIVQAALGNLKKVSLELGGKSPVVVMPDADIAQAIPGVAMATFFLQGQKCMAGTRIFAHEAVHDELVAGLAAFAQGMVLGHGLDPATTQGPMISDAHSAKVMGYIDGAQATLVCGGQKLDRPGNFIQPTIFTDCTPDMAIVREEIFGPVMAVQKFGTTDLDEIAQLANDTPFGLSGSVWACLDQLPWRGGDKYPVRRLWPVGMGPRIWAGWAERLSGNQGGNGAAIIRGAAGHTAALLHLCAALRHEIRQIVADRRCGGLHVFKIAFKRT